jgi:hypothetical protein
MNNKGSSIPMNIDIFIDLTREEYPIKIISNEIYIRQAFGFYSHMASANTYVRIQNDPSV